MSEVEPRACERILVIDDLPEVRQLLRLALESSGYDVVEAGTGAEAMAALDSGKFALAIVDLNLPDCDGADLGRSIRELDPTGTVKLMCITGDSHMAETLESCDCRFDGCIIKPFGVVQLLEQVARLCGGPA